MSSYTRSRVRTSFDIPSFREGREEEFEFRNGYEFEEFMFSCHSHFTDESLSCGVGSFEEELKRAQNWAVEKKRIRKYSKRRRNFSSILYDQIKEMLPKELRPIFRMYITIDTMLDFGYGVDLVFCLGDNVVTIDTTIDPFQKKDKKRINHLLFTHYDLSERRTSSFVRKVARLLTKKNSKGSTWC